MGLPKGMLLVHRCLWTFPAFAKVSIRVWRGPVLAGPAAGGWFVRGSPPNVSGNHESLHITTQGPSEKV